MKSLQIFIYSALSTRPTLKILRYLTANKINILMYHGVIEDEDDLDCWWMLKRSAFERQIEYIHKHFRVVSLDEALDVIFTKKTKAKNLVVLTFDDGYRNFLDIVLPVLQSFDMPCIVYVTTGMVQHNSHIWTDQLFHSFHNSKKIEIDFSDLKLGTWRFDNKIYRRITSHKIIDILKTLPVEEKNDLKKRIIERLRETNSPEERDTVFDLLTIDDIKRISQQALVALGCHTMNHEILTKLPFDMAMNEIRESKDILEQWIGKKVKHFAYPNGSYSEDIVHEVNNIGFRSAVLAGSSGVNHENPHKLDRIGIGAWDDINFFKCNVNGIISIKNALRSNK